MSVQKKARSKKRKKIKQLTAIKISKQEKIKEYDMR